MTHLGTVLGVWAHPDDEAYLSANLMVAAREQGQRVFVATATRGEAGTSDTQRWHPARLAALRRHELTASLAALGVDEHAWLGFRDGTMPACDAEVGVAAVAAVLTEVRPDTIVTFGPEGMTGHPDHQTIHQWTTAAWERGGRTGRLLYATLTPAWHERWGALNERLGVWISGTGPCTEEADVALRFTATGAALDRKLVALRAHASQTTALADAMGEDDFRDWFATEYFSAAPA